MTKPTGEAEKERAEKARQLRLSSLRKQRDATRK
jgi:hypothetical protein